MQPPARALNYTWQRDRGDDAIELIPIHFDVPGHEIPLATFIRTALETQAIIRSLNKELFDGAIQFELVVLPPEDGSFLQRLGVYIIAGWGVIWTFTESDIGKGYIKGLTGHEPSHWAEVAGEATATTFESVVKGESSAAYQKSFSALIICETTKSFLQKDTADLVRVGITPSEFHDAYAARNEFYAACDHTPGLRAIGFTDTPVFPIQKEDFVRLQTDLPPKRDDDEPPWQVAAATLRVTSPNWDRSDRGRSWKGRDERGRDRYFRIDDEEFWHRAAAGAVSAHVIDVMKVQWAYRGRTSQPRDCRVLRVLEFNGEKLAEPLNDDALAAQLGEFSIFRDDQIDLFHD